MTMEDGMRKFEPEQFPRERALTIAREIGGIEAFSQEWRWLTDLQRGEAELKEEITRTEATLIQCPGELRAITQERMDALQILRDTLKKALDEVDVRLGGNGRKLEPFRNTAE